MVSEKHEEKRCPRCGRTFECKLNNPVHCGCAEVELAEDLADELGLAFDDCLCADCLREIAIGGPGRIDTVPS